MEQFPKISIVTASYNSAAYIEKAIESVLSQTYPHIEYLVIDGGSTDGTVDILKRYGTKINWVSEKDTGMYNALNKGFSRATGDVFSWLDSDNFYADNQVLSTVAKAFQISPRPDIVLTDGRLLYPEHNNEQEILSPQHITFEKLLNHGNCLIPESIFYTRELFKKVGGIDEQYRLLADYELWIKLFKTQPQVVKLPLVSAIYTVRSEALLRKDPFGAWRESFAIGAHHGRSFGARLRSRWHYYWERVKFPLYRFMKTHPRIHTLYKKYLRPVARKFY